MATKTERLNLRLTRVQDAVLRRAAESRGEPVSEYVLRHAVEAAETDLADRRVFALGDEAWDRLQETLDRQPRSAPKLRLLLAQPSILDQE
ncbi:MAG: type II toxin-antitoxin system TacA family antitoxin [Mycobacteriales bacterium]